MCEEWAPAGIDTTTPSVARMYDYYLGGKDNFESDRAAAEKVLSTAPETRVAARENRAFLRRVVRYLATECGIRQFIDVGTGLPTQSNLHEIVHELAPEARIVYVDNDPVVLVHARALLAEGGTSDTVSVIQGDLRRPDDIVTHPNLRRLIDFSEPVAVLFVAVLHFVTDDEDPHRIVHRFRDAMAPGSYLMISHASANDTDVDEAVRVYRQATASITPRTATQVASLFTGCDLLEPGAVTTSRWRPEPGCVPADDHNMAVLLGGVARKPESRRR